MSNILKCTPRQARRHIIECIQAGLVPYLQGSPGIGKSVITRSVGKEFALKLIDHRVSTSESTDATGIPEMFDMPGVGRLARFIPFADLFPIEKMPLPEGHEGWLLFLDEFSSAPRQVQAAFYKLMLDRMVGQHRLHSHVAIVAAGNLMTDRAIVNSLSTAMQSRLVHLELQVSFKEWLEDVAIPENYDSRIIAFLSRYPEKLMDFKPEHTEKTFCCPRTWEFMNKLVKGKEVTEDRTVLLSGVITSGVALEFAQFTQVYKDLISVHEIVKDPEDCRLPSDQALKWATITHLLENIDNQNFKPVTTYVDRFDLSFRILFYRMMLARKPKLRTHPEFGAVVSRMTPYLHDS